MVLGSQMASQAFIVICDGEPGKPYMLPESPGRDLVRVNDGIEGRGIGKKVEEHVNRLQTRITKAVNEMLERYEGKLSRTVLR
jgi:hypothetical protein